MSFERFSEAIFEGYKSSFDRYRKICGLISDERLRIPESFFQVIIAEHLKNNYDKLFYEIEADTNSILRHILLNRNHGLSNINEALTPNFLTNYRIERKGFIDILVIQDIEGYRIPVSLIEIKRPWKNYIQYKEIEKEFLRICNMGDIFDGQLDFHNPMYGGIIVFSVYRLSDISRRKMESRIERICQYACQFIAKNNQIKYSLHPSEMHSNDLTIFILNIDFTRDLPTSR